MASTRHTLNLAGDRLTYTLGGDPDATPLLLVHGWMGGRKDWRRLTPTLCADHFCVALDLLGHGDSDRPPRGDYSIPEQARRVLALADHLGLGAFDLCGHSMGGLIALYLTGALAPERVTRLVNLSGVVALRHLGLSALTWIAPAVERLGLIQAGFALARRIAPYRWGQALMGWWIFRRLPPRDFGAVDLAVSLQPGAETPFHRAVAAVLALDVRPWLPHIPCPVLTVFGKRDRLVSPRQGRLAAAGIRNHRLVLLEQAGHYLMLEYPHTCLRLLHDFFRATGAPA